MLVFLHSALFIIYGLSIVLSLVVHHFFLLSFWKSSFPSRTWLSFYIVLISLLASTDLLLYASHSPLIQNSLLIVDGLLTGALLALLVHLYSFAWFVCHGLFSLILLVVSIHLHWKQPEGFRPLLNDFMLISIHLLHALYCFFNGVETYMHRLVALSGTCTSFALILFQSDQQQQQTSSMSLPVVLLHFVQSPRTFFLHSLVICVRHRTSYWQK